MRFISYVTMVFMQYGNLLAIRNRRVSLLNSNPLWGPRRNLAIPAGMVATALIAVINLYGPGLQKVFQTRPIPGMFWGPPFAFGLGILCVDEVRKLIVRSYPKASSNSFSRYLDPDKPNYTLQSIIAKMAW
jgi:sodium/potassium-transporting ATPase subunit alpha